MQAPVSNPVPTPCIEREARVNREQVACQVGETADSPNSEGDAAGVSCHKFRGQSCPGCVCDGCEQTLGGNKGKYCSACYRESGNTFCRSCHGRRQLPRSTDGHPMA